VLDFFEHQARARRKSLWLVVLLGLAVLAITGALYGVAVALLAYSRQHAVPPQPVVLWQPPLLLGVALATLAVVGTGSLFKIAALRDGGAAVADALGGRLVRPDTGDPDERRLMNVVEEMAIASGVAAPAVYVLDEESGINAFAAGYSPNAAAVAVTRGALTLLSRDRLQGVIAHEFSHILHGDMRLNVRLIGLLHGILVIALAGRMLLRSLGRARIRGGSRKGGGGALILILGTGVALLVVGYLGVLFGRLIKAAVSRQREFLADASAVQFTRNPLGLAGALKAIGGWRSGSRLTADDAETVSHMLFATGLRLSRLWATHPPLDERIRRLDPSFDGRFEPHARPTAPGAAPWAEQVSAAAPAAAARTDDDLPISLDPAELLAQIGATGDDRLAAGSALLARVPSGVRAATAAPASAEAVALALLLSPEAEARQRQVALIRSATAAAVIDALEKVTAEVDRLPRAVRLAVLDLAMPALRGLSPEQQARFLDLLDRVIRADRKLSLFEFAIRTILDRGLVERSVRRRAEAQYYGFGPLADAAEVVLSALVHVGEADAGTAAGSFRAAVARLPPARREPRLLPVAECRFGAIETALRRLSGASPAIKERMMDAAAHCVLADRRVTQGEIELLRAVAAGMDVPLGPLAAPPTV